MFENFRPDHLPSDRESEGLFELNIGCQSLNLRNLDGTCLYEMVSCNSGLTGQTHGYPSFVGSPAPAPDRLYLLTVIPHTRPPSLIRRHSPPPRGPADLGASRGNGDHMQRGDLIQRGASQDLRVGAGLQSQHRDQA